MDQAFGCYLNYMKDRVAQIDANVFLKLVEIQTKLQLLFSFLIRSYFSIIFQVI